MGMKLGGRTVTWDGNGAIAATGLVSECTMVLIDEFSSTGLSCACLCQHGWEPRSPVKERIGY